MNSNPVLKHCTAYLNIVNISSKKQNKMETYGKGHVYVSPKGLANPRNHCYRNSVVQILRRIVSEFTEDNNINNNSEGCLVTSLMDSIHANSGHGLAKFKFQLSQFCSFYDGSIQRDAYECFIFILDILHNGTKTNLVHDVLLWRDDQYVDTLTKRSFTYTTNRSFKCVLCRFMTPSYEQSRVLLFIQI